jgi:AraC-like DNA-binding protein
MALAVRSLALGFQGGHHINAHAHGWAQLIYAASGVMRVRSGETLWIVPPARAVWAPAGVEHEIDALGDFAMRTLYFDAALAGDLPAHCYAVDVSPLLRELILEIVAIGMIDEADEPGMRLARVAVDRLAAERSLPLELPLPRDPRAVRVADRLREEPSCELEIVQLARDAGASPRTLQRLFLAETGLRFVEWRQRLRLMHGASRLGLGASVTEAALDAGYASTSAFTVAFRKHFGTIPSAAKTR